MARISAVNIPDNKHVEISLTYIYGIGRARARDICEAAGVEGYRKVSDLSPDELENLRRQVGTYEVDGDLRRKVSLDIKRLMDLGTYRGIRHRRRLPVRGQRTRTNARSRKGPRRPISR